MISVCNPFQTELHVFEDDHGRYRFSLTDEAPSFETRAFAEQVAGIQHRHDDTPRRAARIRGFRVSPMPEVSA
jgi:hypothetical protein